NTAAFQAAQGLGIAYQTAPNANTDGSFTTVCNSIRYPNFVTDNSQFEITDWSPNNNPPTCTVVCTYLSGQNGLPTFPTYNPLHVSISLWGKATYRLMSPVNVANNGGNNGNGNGNGNGGVGNGNGNGNGKH